MVDEATLDATDTIEVKRRPDWLPFGLLLLGLFTHFSHFLSAPPGIVGDAARLGLHAFDLLQRAIWPFYIYHMAAPNPLIVYLQATVFAVLGFTPTALRGVTAFGGALAIPAIYVAGRETFADGGERFSRRAGLIAALGLALYPFFAVYSRYGLEAALLPAIELLAIAFLWRGLWRGRWYDFCLSGILVGISQYTYIVARIFPVALAIACGIALLANRELLARWRGLALAAGSAAVVALPQWLLFIQAPFTLVARTQGSAQPFVFSLPDASAVLGAKFLNQLLMLAWQWENGQIMDSGRPLLTPVLLVGLLVAFGVTLYARRAAWAFCLSLAALLLAPDLLIYEGLSPATNRVMAAVPFVFMAAGLGCAILWTWLEARPYLPGWIGSLVPLLVLLAGIESQWDLASRVLPQVNGTPGLEWKASLVELAEADYVAAHREATILLPSSEYQRAPLAFLLAEHYPRRASGVPIPLSGGEALTVVVPTEPERATTEGMPAGYRPDEWILLKDGAAYFLPPVPNGVEPTGHSEPLYASNSALAAYVFPARWQGVAPSFEPLSVSFVNGLDLVGYRLGEFATGQALTATFYWQPSRSIETDVQVFVQLLDRNGYKVAAIHDWPLREAYRIRAWQPLETMPLSYRLDIPPDLPSGPYRLIVGLYDLIHQERIPLLDGPEFLTLASFRIPLPPISALPAQTIQAEFGKVIGLTGYTLSPSATGLEVALFWEASDPPQADYTVFVHLVDAGGQIAAQADAQPLGGQYPTSIWAVGETVVDQRTIPVSPGEYEVYVGLYQWETLERLSATLAGERLPEDRLSLGVVKLP